MSNFHFGPIGKYIIVTNRSLNRSKHCSTMFNTNVKGLPRIIFHNRLEKLDNRDQKLMLRLWLDRHFVYLMRIETINAHLYVHQMQRVDKCLIEKQPVLIKKKNSLVNESARPYTSKMTEEKILELDWSALSHVIFT